MAGTGSSPGPYRRVFVLYPRGFRTGGPEALHQLVDTLRGLGQDALLVPMSGTAHHPRVPQYSHYDAPEADSVEDADDCAVVAPEISLDLLYEYRRARRFCWWLSIDNAPSFGDERSLIDLRHGGNVPATQKRSLERGSERARRLRARRDFTTVHHVTQSIYAWSFLYAQLDIVGSMLSDYTRVEAFDSVDLAVERDAVVCYNPAKDRMLSEMIAAEVPDVRFVPIRDMHPEEVVSTLASASVYLDMGPHPGKDRLPREAALAGAISVVARRGAGAFLDVPIPWEHKVSMTDPVGNGATVLQRVLADPARARALQLDYRTSVRKERDIFTAEASAIFLQNRLEFGAEGPPVRDV